MVELVYTPDLKSGAERIVGSSPTRGTTCIAAGSFDASKYASIWIMPCRLEIGYKIISTPPSSPTAEATDLKSVKVWVRIPPGERTNYTAYNRTERKYYEYRRIRCKVECRYWSHIGWNANWRKLHSCLWIVLPSMLMKFRKFSPSHGLFFFAPHELLQRRRWCHTLNLENAIPAAIPLFIIKTLNHAFRHTQIVI